jgi:hypothetical protein
VIRSVNVSKALLALGSTARYDRPTGMLCFGGMDDCNSSAALTNAKPCFLSPMRITATPIGANNQSKGGIGKSLVITSVVVPASARIAPRKRKVVCRLTTF